MTTVTLFGILFSTAVGTAFAYLFLITRGALITHAFIPRAEDRFHVYWVYSHMGLIRFSDRKPWVAAVLLFQYDRLVDRVVQEIRRTELVGKSFLMTACAFGDVMPRVVEAVNKGGARHICIADLIKNELVHAARKLSKKRGNLEYIEADARQMPQRDGAVGLNLIFFLLHELPDAGKARTLREAARVVTPGGKLIIAEFHRPRLALMRLLGRIYFSVLEPYALSMWDEYDPIPFLEKLGGWRCRRSTYFFGNFQVIVATRNG